MRPRARRRGGFTLIELMVYLGLATTGLLVLGSIEVAAHRALALQEALIDIDLASAALLGELRQDVEAAQRVAVDGQTLVVERVDGRRVRYEAGVRLEDGAGAPERRTEYPVNTRLEVTLEAPADGPPLVSVAATFVRRGVAGEVSRTFRRSAAPRREVGGA